MDGMDETLIVAGVSPVLVRGGTCETRVCYDQVSGRRNLYRI